MKKLIFIEWRIKMSLSKKEYIEEAKRIIFYELGDHILTDIDDGAAEILEGGDIEAYCEFRSKGNIVRFDHTMVIWLNGICFAWNYIHEKDDDFDCLYKNDIIPNFMRIFDNSRIIGHSGNSVLYGEFCRL